MADDKVRLGQIVGLYGPGDLTGIERRAIVRVEPRDWITDYEPNYLPHIEFYDEDFPWRYTPAAPDRSSRFVTLTPRQSSRIRRNSDVGGAPWPRTASRCER